MFTRATFKSLAVFYRISEKLFAFPYTWDGKTLRPASQYQVAIFAFMTAVFILNIVHLLFNLIRLVLGDIEVDTRQGFFIISYSAWYFLVANFSFQMLYYRMEMSLFLKQLFELNQDFSSAYAIKANERMPRDYSALIIRIATGCIFGGPPCFGFLMLWYPDDYQYFCRYFFPVIGRSWWVLGLMCAWEVYQVTVSWIVMLFCWFHLMLHCTSCRFWIEQITWQMKAPARRITQCESMPINERIAMYRKIQILNMEYNRLNRWFFALGLKVSTIVHDAQAIYCFSLMFGMMVLFMYICFSSLFFGFTSIIVVTYSMAGNVYHTACLFIKSAALYATEGQLSYYKRCIKSFYPISVTVGTFYRFERSTTITIIGVVVSLSTNAILMTLSHERNAEIML